MLPTKIEQVFDYPTVADQIKAVGEAPILNQIEFELECLADLMSVGGNLTTAQIVFIAKQLIEIFPAETLADFKICFHRGAIGQYGPIQRMDGITLREWMEKYLEEKYQVLEDKLMREKETHYFRLPQKRADLIDPEKHQVWLDKLKEAAAPGMKQVPEVDERYVKPKRKAVAPEYDNGLTERDAHNRTVLRRAASEFYKGRTSLNLQGPFVIDGFEIMAESESDAKAIYERVKP